jgi:hypothetical protein
MNIHFMLKSNGTGNYTEHDNGKVPATPGQNGFWYAQSLIDYSNIQLANNQPMYLPIGNTTPNPETKIRVALTGVYFHRDDAYYYYTPANRNSNALNNTYGVNKNFEVNIFVQQDTPSVSYGGNACGIGHCAIPWIKLTGIWLNTSPNSGASPAQMGSAMNHELGHVLGLGHTYTAHPNINGKVCSDTPANKSPWCSPPIDGGTNNIMDYNCGQNAITPCQLAIMQNELDNYYSDFFVCCSGYPVTVPVHIGSPGLNNEKIILDGSWRTHKCESDYQIEIYRTDTTGSQNNLGKHYSESFSGQYGFIDLTEIYWFVPGNFYKIKLTINGRDCNKGDYVETWVKIAGKIGEKRKEKRKK